MKTITQGYKDSIKEFGRQLDSKVTYELNGETIELGGEELNSITPVFKGDILKSVMKELDVDSNVDIPLGTVINYQFGVKVGNSYEYINYGNFVVYKSEKQEDTRSWKITCYDKMLYAMKDYEEVAMIYPTTVRSYIDELCQTLGLTFKNASDTFANYDKVIPSDLYKGIGYTYRDVFDELAQVTASTICINEDDDEVEIRYITETNDTIDEEFLKNVNVEFGEKYGPVNSIVLSRSAESDNVYLRDEESVTENGLCEIKIKDNQIMNFNDRSDYLQDILNQLDGLEYYINDFTSTGITYFELCDRYNVEVFGNTYSCILFNDETKVTQGLEEVIYTDMPEGTVTDYSKADKTDRRINQVYIIADKQAGQIQSLVTQNIENETQIRELQTQMTQTSESLQVSVSELTEQLNQTSQDLSESIDNINSTLNDGVETLKNTLVTIDINGISVSTNTSAISTLMTNDKFAIQTKSGSVLAYFGYDYNIGKTVSRMDNLEITTYLTAGYHRQEKMSNGRTGWFYNGGA